VKNQKDKTGEKYLF